MNLWWASIRQMTTIRYTVNPHHFKLVQFLSKLRIPTRVGLIDDRPLMFMFSGTIVDPRYSVVIKNISP